VGGRMIESRFDSEGMGGKDAKDKAQLQLKNTKTDAVLRGQLT